MEWERLTEPRKTKPATAKPKKVTARYKVHLSAGRVGICADAVRAWDLRQYKSAVVWRKGRDLGLQLFDGPPGEGSGDRALSGGGRRPLYVSCKAAIDALGPGDYAVIREGDAFLRVNGNARVVGG